MYAPAVGLMLLDMLLGPAHANHMDEAGPGFLDGINATIASLLGKAKKFKR